MGKKARGSFPRFDLVWFTERSCKYLKVVFLFEGTAPWYLALALVRKTIGFPLNFKIVMPTARVFFLSRCYSHRRRPRGFDQTSRGDGSLSNINPPKRYVPTSDPVKI